MATTESLVSRRTLLWSGVYAGAAALISPLLGDAVALAQTRYCNPARPTTPSAALTALNQGSARWATFDQEHPGEDKTRRTCLVGGQQPFAAILSCSDSRIPPELIFDQGLGDLFVVRVAGNSNTVVGEESLAYAAGGRKGDLSVPALVLFVLGHQSCGAVSAAVDNFPNEAVPQFVEAIYPAVRSAKDIVKKNGGDPNDKSQVLPVAVDQNVILTVDALSKKQPFAKAIAAGNLLAAGGRYDLTTQRVKVLIPA